MAKKPFRSILVTGASGALGSAVAQHYASRANFLYLGGRNQDKLDAVADRCRKKGAHVTATAVDVTDAPATARWVLDSDASTALDLIICCAGISGETGQSGDAPGLTHRIYEVNVLGTLNTVEPLLPRFRERRHGHIAVVASAAGFRGIARGPAYSGSKAALIQHTQGWREALAPFGIGATCICPGYLKTSWTERHDFDPPFIMTPEAAAKRIAAALDRNKALAVFPWQVAFAGWLFRALPARATRWMVP